MNGVTKLSRVGETNKSTNGQMMTIIAYRNTHDIDVQFEDGTIVSHRVYRFFRNGSIANPNANKYVVQYVGQTRKSNCGQMMTLIAYRHAQDIDVQFEDGAIVRHKQYSCFTRGEIRNPNFFKSRVGESCRATNGQMMTIIAYRKYNDLDVQFEDGTIIEHKSYTSFQRGLIHNPNFTHNVSQRKYRTGQTKMMNCGIALTVSLYRKYKNIDVIFETGCKLEHRRYRDFELGTIKHPLPYQVGIVSIDKLAYIRGDVGNFYCHCTKCKVKDIMTVEEVKNHICKEGDSL